MSNLIVKERFREVCCKILTDIVIVIEILILKCSLKFIDNTIKSTD